VKSTLARALIAGSLIAAGLSLSAPAMAERAVHRDAEDDVVANAFSDIAQAPISGYPEADVKKLVVRHGHARVVMKVTVEDLKMRTFVYALFALRLDGNRTDVTILKKKGKPTKVDYYFNGRSTCRGLRKSLDRDLDQISISIPRRCLNNPSVVQVAAVTLTSDLTVAALNDIETDEELAGHFFGDDALRDGSTRRQERLTWGPELRRG
jgi:hypothetical protein